MSKITILGIFVADIIFSVDKIPDVGESILGDSYNIGTGFNITNLNLTKLLLKIVRNKKMEISKRVKIKFVKDRPGHDFRYALNSRKILKELKWKPKINFDSGLNKTLSWYIENYSFFNYFSKKIFFKRLGLKL